MSRLKSKWFWRGVGGGLLAVLLVVLWWIGEAKSDPNSFPAVFNRDYWPWVRWLLPLMLITVGGLWVRHWARTRMPGGLVQRWTRKSQTTRGMAGWWEALRVTGRWSLLRKIRVLRPALTEHMKWWQLWRVPSRELGVELGKVQFDSTLTPRVRAYARTQENTVSLAPTQGGKTSQMANIVIDAPGAVLATSTNPNIVEHTVAMRERRGPVAIFNPNRVGGIGLRSTFRWSPVYGCEDPAVAIKRAGYLLAGSPDANDVGSRRFWESQGVRILSRLMHAAGLLDASIHDVNAWASEPDATAHIVLDALDQSPAGPSWTATYRGWLETNHATRSSVTTTLMPALEWLNDPEVAVAAMASRSEQFDVGEWLNGHGTLYLLAEDQQHGSLAPLFTCFTADVYSEIKTRASRSLGGRLDPPARFVLDEAALVCPVPLETWTADAAGRGLGIDLGLQSKAQLDWKWGRDAARIIWDNLTVKMIFGGYDSPEDLEEYSKACGTITELDAEDKPIRVPVLPPERIRTLPENHTLLLRRGMRPAITRFTPVYARRDVKAAKRAAARGTAPAWVPQQALPAGSGAPSGPAAVLGQRSAPAITPGPAQVIRGPGVQPEQEAGRG